MPRASTLVATVLVCFPAAGEVTMLPNGRGALVVWDRSDGEVVSQLLDESLAPLGQAETVVPAGAQPRPDALVAGRVDGAWILVRTDFAWRAFRIDDSGAISGAPWEIELPGAEIAEIAGDSRYLYVGVQAAGEVLVARFGGPGAPSAERVLPLPGGHRLLGLVLAGRDLHILTVGTTGRGLAIRTVPTSLDEDGSVRTTNAGQPGARWTRPTMWSGGLAAVVAAGPSPVGVRFRPGRPWRVVETAHASDAVTDAALAPWAGAGWVAWVVEPSSSAPVAAIRALDEALSPHGRVLCAPGFVGASLAGLVAGRDGTAVGWAGLAQGGILRVAASRPGGTLRWLAGQEVAEFAPAGALDPDDVATDGSTRIRGRSRPVVLAELAGAREKVIAAATRRGTTAIAYAAVRDGRRRVRLVTVDPRGRATPPRTVSSTARVEPRISVEWTNAGFAIRWLEERGRSVVVAERILAP